MTPTPPHVTYAEAAARLGVSVARISQLVGQGRLAVVHLDARSPRVTVESLEAEARRPRRPGRPTRPPG